jgi:NAD(P)-dependent dehydrogenase (short-subunit alcohol dehydrogenase family)
MARVALVTGGTRGIGRAIVERLTADGYKVAAGYSGNDAAAESLKRETGAMVIKGNVGNWADCQHAVAAVEAELGPIDILVNNAGITRDGVFHRMNSEQWSEVIRVNMDSLFNMTRQVIEGMRAREWGRHGERHRAGLYRHRDGAGGAGKGAGGDHRADSGGPSGSRRRDRRHGGLPGRRAGRICDRNDTIVERRTVPGRLRRSCPAKTSPRSKKRHTP